MRELGDLPAGQLAHPSGQGVLGEAEPGDLGGGPVLDVPVVADRVEVGLVGRPGLDGADRAQGPVDAEELRHRLFGRKGEVLGQVADPAGDGDVARRWV